MKQCVQNHFMCCKLWYQMFGRCMNDILMTHPCPYVKCWYVVLWHSPIPGVVCGGWMLICSSSVCAGDLAKQHINICFIIGLESSHLTSQHADNSSSTSRSSRSIINLTLLWVVMSPESPVSLSSTSFLLKSCLILRNNLR